MHDLIVSTHEGDIQLDQDRVFAERSMSQLDAGPNGELELVVGGEERPGNWLPLDPATTHVLVRQYFDDWERTNRRSCTSSGWAPPARVPPPLTADRAAEALIEAAEWVERSLVYWNDYLRRIQATAPVNVLNPPISPPGGAGDILYGGGIWQLGEDEALLVDCEVPEAELLVRSSSTRSAGSSRSTLRQPPEQPQRPSDARRRRRAVPGGGG